MRPARSILWATVPLGIALLLAPAEAGAAEAILPSVRDNTLYESAGGDLANGEGVHVFAGQASGRRRALLRFDVASAVPQGSTITQVTLALHCSRSPLGGGSTAVAVHRVLEDWGEGGSDAGDPGGDGAESEAGDATWVHGFYPDVAWSTPGGAFIAAPSASTTIGTPNDYTWSSAGLVADVQKWADDPDANFGWILVGVEGGATNARRFDSREHPTEAARPRLAVTFIPPVGVRTQAWSQVKALFR